MPIIAYICFRICWLEIVIPLKIFRIEGMGVRSGGYYMTALPVLGVRGRKRVVSVHHG